MGSLSERGIHRMLWLTFWNVCLVTGFEVEIEGSLVQKDARGRK